MTSSVACVRVRQDWFHADGQVGMWGISYLGYVQWALLAGLQDAHASAPGGVDKTLPKLAALFPIMTSSNMHPVCYPDGATAMDLLLRWLHLTHYIGGTGMAIPRPRSLTWRHKLFLREFAAVGCLVLCLTVRRSPFTVVPPC